MLSRTKPRGELSRAKAVELRPDSLRWLVCPVCRAGLDLIAAEDIAQQRIQCTGCARKYSVVDGIPLLMYGI